MKQSVFFLLFSFFFYIEKGKASECYHYHTKTSYEVVVEGEAVFLVMKTKDPNGISISGYSKEKLPISAKEARFVAHYYSDIVIVANADYYYAVEVGDYAWREKKAPLPLFKTERVSENFGSRMFCIDGKWQWISIDIYHRKIETKLVENFPDRAEMLHDFGYQNFLLKNKHSLVIFDERDQKVTPIVGLNTEKVRFEKGEDPTDTCFIFDEHSFYGIERNGKYFNMTEDFKMVGFKGKFTDARWIRSSLGGILLDFQDGDLWVCDEKRQMKFYPLKNSTYYPQNGLIFYNDRYYSGVTDLQLYHGYGFDVSRVNLAQLRELDKYDLYYDDFQYYTRAGRVFRPVRIGEESQKLLLTKTYQDQSFHSYRGGTKPFKVVDNVLYFFSVDYNRWNWMKTPKIDFIIEEKISLKTPIKELTMGFLFNDVLLIENQMVKNIGNRDTMEFVGSTVDVISGCDGGDGTLPVEVSYHYFYKDDQAVYHYNEKDKEMKKLPFNPKNFDEEAMCAYFFKEK